MAARSCSRAGRGAQQVQKGPTCLRPLPRSAQQPARVVRARAEGPVTIEDVAALQSCSVLPVLGGPACTAGSLIAPDPALTLLIFFTHWADLGSWELAQRLVEKRAEIEATGVKLIGVGLGSPEAGAEFAARTKFPADALYAEPTSACHKALRFDAGALPDSDVSGYAKATLMLAGIGSPGTMQEVLRGYIGDRNSKPIFPEESFWGSAFGTVGKGYQRPFELATLRLQNMIGSLSNWSKLAPEDSQQLVQQGGSLLLRGDKILFTHKDSGILMTTDVDALLPALKAAAAVPLKA